MTPNTPRSETPFDRLPASRGKEEIVKPSVLWNGSVDELLDRLATAPTGLTTSEAEIRLKAYGPNDPAAAKSPPIWLQFIGRFRSPLVLILLVASGLSAAAGDLTDFIIITTIVALSISLDFIQEFRAHNAVEALRRSVAVRASVKRDGQVTPLSVDRLVPGDIIELIAGDLIPADARLTTSRDLFVNQALLTGEPYPAEKRVEPGTDADAPGGQANAVFAGTSVVSGTATAVVCCTGRNTLLGGLARSLAEKAPATDFNVGIRRFGQLILRFTIILVLFVIVVNIGFDRPALEVVLFALALAVGLTPELLPMIITVTLARSAIELARRKVIVKRLAAIHDCGAMDVLCTDKTGTLTESKIDLVRTVDGDGRDNPKTFVYAYLNSLFESGMKSPLDEAILARHHDSEPWRKIDEVPFDFERRRVSVLIERGNERLLIVKGAPEDVLRLSGRYETASGKESLLDQEARQRFRRTFEDLGAEGYRLLGVATRPVDQTHSLAVVADESALVFAGFAVFLDPPKSSAGTTMQAARLTTLNSFQPNS